MLLYRWEEITLMLIAAMAVDWIIGDPIRLPHPVRWIGLWIDKVGGRLLHLPAGPAGATRRSAAFIRKVDGIVLALSTVLLAYGVMYLVGFLADAAHPWLGYAIQTWFISTTMAIRGLRDAAMQVFHALKEGKLERARAAVGQIVGRDTGDMDAGEVSRAAVESVAENIVDAVVAPIFYALLGGAPLAMFYRAANTLDSMVGYKNELYADFGWASARLDDCLNYIPARLTGGLIVLYSFLAPGLSGAAACRSILLFARLHPSPNSGIPEAAVAGALGIELGGTNRYNGVISERARMGWPLRPLVKEDIIRTIRILNGVGILLAGVGACAIGFSG